MTDHRKEAEALLGQADRYPSSDYVLETGERKADVIANAQVHALLAIGEHLEAIVKTDVAVSEIVGAMGADRAAEELQEAQHLMRLRESRSDR
jgi:hypothetical protein